MLLNPNFSARRRELDCWRSGGAEESRRQSASAAGRSQGSTTARGGSVRAPRAACCAYSSPHRPAALHRTRHCPLTSRAEFVKWIDLPSYGLGKPMPQVLHKHHLELLDQPPVVNSNARLTPAVVEEAVVHRVVEEVVDLSKLLSDPAQRRPISQFKTAKVRDDVRRAYLQKGSFQPKKHNFLQTDMSGVLRRFNPEWFKEYSRWLEYSIDEEAAFCLSCYLFQNETLGHGGGDAFSTKGWKLWNKCSRLNVHVGGPSSAHNQNLKRCDDLMNQKQSIEAAIVKQTKKSKRDYRPRLIASIDIARLLLISGLPFRGHDESESSKRKGNFLTFYEWYAARCPEVGAVALGNAPKNLKLVCSAIQKEIVRACAEETLKAIIEDIGDEYFAILVDESRDASHKEQMALVIRYVERRGFVMERLLDLLMLVKQLLLH